MLAGSVPEDDVKKVDDASLPKEVENVEQTNEEEHQKVDECLPQSAEENSLDQNQRVEENNEQVVQNVNEDTQEGAEILALNMMIGEAVQDEHMKFSTDFDLSIEDVNTVFNEEVFQETPTIEDHNVPVDQNVPVSTDQNAQVADQNVQVTIDQNVDKNASNEPLLSQDQLSADHVLLASGSLPSMEVQLMTQPNQNIYMSSSTMEVQLMTQPILISPLPTPNTIPSCTPPPPPIKTTNKLPNMSTLFDSLNTFVTANKETVEAFGAAPPAKPSRAEKLASRAHRVSTKTHKIACVLAKWTVDAHAHGLAIPPPVFYDHSIFESEPSSDSGDSTP